MRFVSIFALSLMALGASASALPDAFPEVGLEARKSQCAGVAAGSNCDVNGKRKCSRGCRQIVRLTIRFDMLKRENESANRGTRTIACLQEK